MKEIKLYGVISNEGFLGMGENGYIERMANEIKAADNEDIKLRINTPGGSVFDGFAIITNLLEHSGKLNMQVDGFAASMGGAILAYADEATAYDFAKVMLHKVYTNSTDEESLGIVNSLNSDFAKMFKSKGVDADLMDEIFLGEENKDYWFSAQEAKDIGLINEVLESNQTQKAAASSEDLISKYYQFTNQKKEVVMFKNSKEALQKLQDQSDELEALKSEVPTKESITNLVREEIDKVADKVNQANKEKADKAAAENQTDSEKLDESIKAIAGAVDKITETVEQLSKKIDDIVAEIQKTVSDFKVPEVVDGGTEPDKPLTVLQQQASLNQIINAKNAEKI